MSGGYVTQTRVLNQPVIRYGYENGSYNVTPNVPMQDASIICAPTTQETTSWRTTRSEDPNHQAEVDELSRVTRNGFSTFDPEFDSGHTFRTRTFSMKLSHPSVKLNYRYNGQYYRYYGALMPQTQLNSEGFPPQAFRPNQLNWLTQNEIADFGQRAILGCAPARPQANTATSLLELISDGLPNGIFVNLADARDTAKTFRSAGSEYLNAQFGWVPMISDIRKTVSALQRSTAILSQLQRDSGRIVRRRFSFDPIISNTVTEIPVNHQVAWVPSQMLETAGTDVRWTIANDRQYTKYWFSGAFQYYFPGFDTFAESVQSYQMMAQVLLGNQVTPEVLWEIAPWSWLVDWRLKIGQMLSAAQVPADGLVVRYGYLMRHQTREVSYIPKTPVQFKNGWKSTPSFTLRTESKERVRSTPYGFATTTSQFSAQQWSILAALGLTRGDKVLRLVS